MTLIHQQTKCIAEIVREDSLQEKLFWGTSFEERLNVLNEECYYIKRIPTVITQFEAINCEQNIYAVGCRNTEAMLWKVLNQAIFVLTCGDIPAIAA